MKGIKEEWMGCGDWSTRVGDCKTDAWVSDVDNSMRGAIRWNREAWRKVRSEEKESRSGWQAEFETAKCTHAVIRWWFAVVLGTGARVRWGWRASSRGHLQRDWRRNVDESDGDRLAGDSGYKLRSQLRGSEEEVETPREREGAAGGGKKGLWGLGRHGGVSRAWSAGSAPSPRSGRADALVRAVFTEGQSSTRVLWAEESTRDEGWGRCPEVRQEERRKKLEDWSGNVCLKTNIGETCVSIITVSLSVCVFTSITCSAAWSPCSFAVYIEASYLAGAHDTRGDEGSWCLWKACCQG